MSTRPDEAISKNLDPKYPIIDVQKKGIKKDIATFLQARMLQHSGLSEFDPGFDKKTTDTILEKSRDMFLLASLHIDRVLRYEYQQGIEDVFESLPEKLTDAYEKGYKQATDRDKAKEFTKRALRWVLCSERPLTTDELLFAISQDPTNDFITAADREVSERKILKSCQNLLSLDCSNEDDNFDINRRRNGRPVWRLAHQAVAEFLETKDDCHLYRAHFEAAKLCLKLLRDDSFGASVWILSHPELSPERSEDLWETSETSENSETSGYSESDSKISKDSLCPCTENRGPRITRSWGRVEVAHLELENPLAEYATYAWPTHVRAYEHSADRIPETVLHRLSQTLQGFLGKPNEGSRIFKRWYEHIGGRGGRDGMVQLQCRHPPWCIFASRGLHSVDPERGETEMTPIILACHLALYTTIKEWWDAPDLKYDACFHSYSGSMSILWIGGQAMTWSLAAVACANDEVEILKWLLGRGAKVDTQAEDDIPAIVAAAARNSTEAARELTQRGTNLRSGFTERCISVLGLAMFHGSWDVMELLLKHYDIEQLEIGRALRRLPFEQPRLERAISMLLDFGVDANSSLKGATLLATEAYHGYEDMVLRLLDKGAEVNTKCENNSFSYALDAALDPMHKSIAHRLVAKGGRISGRFVRHILRLARGNKDWDKALHLLRGHVNGVWETSQRGFGDDGYSISPLIEEVRAGNVDSVRDLIKFGVDVNLRVDGYDGDALNTVFVSTLDRDLITQRARVPHRPVS